MLKLIFVLAFVLAIAGCGGGSSSPSSSGGEGRILHVYSGTTQVGYFNISQVYVNGEMKTSGTFTALASISNWSFTLTAEQPSKPHMPLSSTLTLNAGQVADFGVYSTRSAPIPIIYTGAATFTLSGSFTLQPTANG